MNTILVENKDYTVENGLYVFTTNYLKQRGFCCKNACRNCPFGFSQKTVMSKIRIK